MTQKLVLDIGQCVPDHQAIRRLIESNASAQVMQAAGLEDASRLAQEYPFDLFLINRILDADGGSGMDVLSALKSNPSTQHIPVMLVSNYHDAQIAAIEKGALPGFGKSALEAPATLAAIQAALGLA